MGLARSAGQILYDLAIKDVDKVLGSRERFAARLYTYLIEKDEPTENFFRLYDTIAPHSMVKHHAITFVACLSRFATVEMIGKGMLIEDKTSTDEG
tara:strand:- start:7318 stop:7605 length:288 start_codon:yes stop_codon:yes gene_type:complete